MYYTERTTYTHYTNNSHLSLTSQYYQFVVVHLIPYQSACFIKCCFLILCVVRLTHLHTTCPTPAVFFFHDSIYYLPTLRTSYHADSLPMYCSAYPPSLPYQLCLLPRPPRRKQHITSILFLCYVPCVIFRFLIPIYIHYMH
jgi:hypothetical protein